MCNSRGSEHLEFCDLNMLVAHRGDISSDLKDELNLNISKHFPGGVLIDKSYEYEQMKLLSSTYVNVIEFIMGLVCLISGRPDYAYKLHLKIYENRKYGFRNEQLFQDARRYLDTEFSVMALPYIKEHHYGPVHELIKEHERNVPDGCSAKIVQAQLFIRESYTESEYRAASKRGLDILNTLQVDTAINRATLLVNRGYLYLLQKDYKAAEKAYRAADKYISTAVIESAIDYCDDIIAMPEKIIEHPTAYYVRALMMIKGNYSDPEIMDALKLAAENSGIEEEYAIPVKNLSDKFRKVS